ncbi:hypothetical protein BDV19DRAFT_361053 [Aspergillus venezuelensis]
MELARLLVKGAKIITTTLSNASCDILGVLFRPDFLLCDEASQCSESDLTIALTYASLRGVVLVGYPEQSPTILSHHSGNEDALFLRRSLMQRLLQSHYPHHLLDAGDRRTPLQPGPGPAPRPAPSLSWPNVQTAKPAPTSSGTKRPMTIFSKTKGAAG